ncbi:MAG: hypothetical protein ACJ75S_08435 [Solirubrobacterales bacterium]
MGRLRTLGALAVVLGASLWTAQAVQATFHQMSIREVYPGANDGSYVELQMWSSGQNFVKGRHLVAYDAAGKAVDDFAFASNVANGANQSTILVADTNYPLAFDERPAPDASEGGLNLSPAGGAVCWIEGSPPDCVAWGAFTGPLPAHVPTLKVGNPASPGGVGAGMALRRSIAKGCATLLDSPSVDDNDDSATDFAEVEPNPRDNAISPIESPCKSANGGGGGSGGPGGPGGNAPQTLLKRKPPHKTHDRTPTFRFAADERGVTFQCRLDGKPYRHCRSPFTTKKLALGRHVFRVRARDDSGGVDPSPASYAFKVLRG